MVNQGGIYIALGSNLGDREEHIRGALRELTAGGDVRVCACSNLHETEALGGPPGQGRYLNAVAELATDLSPHALMNRLQAIEQQHGRVRVEPNGPRTLDLDLLLYGSRVVKSGELTLPHPRMWEREFVQAPLAEVCPPTVRAAARRLCGLQTPEGTHVH